SLSAEPPTFPPPDCANNAPFTPMRRHCGSSVYVHPPLGTGGCNAHATHFGNRDNWGWGVRGSAIDGGAGVRRRSVSRHQKGATRHPQRPTAGRPVGEAAKESEPPRAPNSEGASKARTGGATRRCPREGEQACCAGAGGPAHLAERGRSRRDGAAAACG